MDSDHRNKRNKLFHLNLFKKQKEHQMGGVKHSKKSFHNIVWSQSVLTTSFGKIVGIKEPQTDSHVTVQSVINVKHQPTPKMKSMLSLLLKLNVKVIWTVIPTKFYKKSQLIDEHFLKEPESTENELKLIDEQFFRRTSINWILWQGTWYVND